MCFNWNVEGTWNLLTPLLSPIMWQLRRNTRYYVWAQASDVWFLLGKVVEIILFRSWHCTRRVISSVTAFRVCAVLLPLCTPSCHGALTPEKVDLTFTLCRNSTSMFARLVCFQNVWQWFNSKRSVVIGTNARRHLPSWCFEISPCPRTENIVGCVLNSAVVKRMYASRVGRTSREEWGRSLELWIRAHKRIKKAKP
jgi:hypothetical protein